MEINLDYFSSFIFGRPGEAAYIDCEDFNMDSTSSSIWVKDLASSWILSTRISTLFSWMQVFFALEANFYLVLLISAGEHLIFLVPLPLSMSKLDNKFVNYKF